MTMSSIEIKPTKRIPFDSLTLMAVIQEMHPLLVGGQIQDIRQPERESVVLTVRSGGKNYSLLLDCSARAARVHLISSRPPNAKSPPVFCMALRAHIENGVIQDIRQRDFDRVIEIEILSNDTEGVKHSFLLVAELMGKHSNIILLRREASYRRRANA